MMVTETGTVHLRSQIKYVFMAMVNGHYIYLYIFMWGEGEGAVGCFG